MANYGFTTYDPQTQRIEGIVNSKFPIFGPRYDQIKTCFKTFHVSEEYVQPYRTYDLTLPPTSHGEVTQNGYYAYEKTLLKKIPHKLKTTPLGYWVCTGALVKNTRMRLDFSNVSEFYQGLFPPSFSATGTVTHSFDASGAAGQPILDLSGQTLTPLDTFYINQMTVNTSGDVNIIVPNNYPLSLHNNAGYGYGHQVIPGDNTTTPDGTYGVESVIRYPYTVEVDDEYIYIYRLTYWCDIWSRLYEDTQSSGTHVYYDERARSKGAIDYAGSEADITIYLCPYSMEDLI